MSPTRPKLHYARGPLLLILALAFTSCSWSGADTPKLSPSSTPGPNARPAATVGVANDIPGFNVLISAETNERRGFDYDITNWIGDNSVPGFRPTLAPVIIGKREDFLRDNRLDLVIDVLSITSARRQNIGIAGPYLLTRQGLLTRRGEPAIENLDQLSGGIPVCTIEGSTSETRLLPLAAQGRIALTSVTGTSGCSERLARGEDAVFSTDQLILKGVAEQQQYTGRFALSNFTFGTAEQFGIGYRKGDIQTCQMLTEGIKKMIVDLKWRDFFMQNFPGLDPNGGYRPDPQALDRCE